MGKVSLLIQPSCNCCLTVFQLETLFDCARRWDLWILPQASTNSRHYQLIHHNDLLFFRSRAVPWWPIQRPSLNSTLSPLPGRFIFSNILHLFLKCCFPINPWERHLNPLPELKLSLTGNTPSYLDPCLWFSSCLAPCFRFFGWASTPWWEPGPFLQKSRSLKLRSWRVRPQVTFS